MNPKDIGNFLTKLRKEAGLTQEELSEYLHLTHQAVSKWETGNGIPDILTVIELSNLYNVTIGEIFAGERSTNENGVPIKDEQEKPIINIKGYVRKKNRQRRIKRYILNSIPIILVLLIFTFILLLCFYKTNKIYSLSYSDTNLEIYNSIIYINDKHITWKTGTITYNNEPISYNNTIITLYYENNSDYIEFMKFSYDGEDKICIFKECKKLRRYIKSKNLNIKIKTVIDDEPVELVLNPQVIKIEEDKENELYAKDATNLKDINYLSNKECLYNNGYSDYDELSLSKKTNYNKIEIHYFIKKEKYFLIFESNNYKYEIFKDKIFVFQNKTLIQTYNLKIETGTYGIDNFLLQKVPELDYIIKEYLSEIKRINSCNNK